MAALLRKTNSHYSSSAKSQTDTFQQFWMSRHLLPRSRRENEVVWKCIWRHRRLSQLSLLIFGMLLLISFPSISLKQHSSWASLRFGVSTFILQGKIIPRGSWVSKQLGKLPEAVWSAVLDCYSHGYTQTLQGKKHHASYKEKWYFIISLFPI